MNVALRWLLIVVNKGICVLPRYYYYSVVFWVSCEEAPSGYGFIVALSFGAHRAQSEKRGRVRCRLFGVSAFLSIHFSAYLVVNDNFFGRYVGKY